MVNKAVRGYYTDLGEMPIYNFDKCMSGNLNFMYKSKEGEITEELKEVYTKLFNEWCELTYNNEILGIYSKIIQIEYLKTRLKIVPLLIDVLLKTPKGDQKELFITLRKWKMNIYEEKDIKKCYIQLKAAKTKLSILKDELKELTNKNDVDVKQTIQRQSIVISKQLGVKVDIYKDSVLHWHGYFQELQKLSSKDGK